MSASEVITTLKGLPRAEAYRVYQWLDGEFDAEHRAGEGRRLTALYRSWQKVHLSEEEILALPRTSQRESALRR